MDEHSVDRTRRLTAIRDLEAPKGINSFSFLSLPDAQLVTNISNLGVSLGRSDHSVHKAIKQFKSLEHGRLASLSPIKTNVKRDLLKELDEIDMQANDGFDQLLLKQINSEALDDCLTGNNSHLDDICFPELRKKSAVPNKPKIIVPNLKKGTRVKK